MLMQLCWYKFTPISVKILFILTWATQNFVANCAYNVSIGSRAKLRNRVMYNLKHELHF
jgi:hypothetical protein